MYLNIKMIILGPSEISRDVASLSMAGKRYELDVTSIRKSSVFLSDINIWYMYRNADPSGSAV
jgi:hypothetical protein